MSFSFVGFSLQKKLCMTIFIAVALLKQICYGIMPIQTANDTSFCKITESSKVVVSDVMQQRLKTWERNLAAWTNQPRGYVSCNPQRIERLLAGQTNTALAVQLTNAWERLQLACTNQPIKLNEYIRQTLKEKGGPKGYQAQFAKYFFTMLTCLPLKPLAAPCIGIDQDYHRSDVLKWYITKEALNAAPYLIESGDTFLDMANLVGDMRTNVIQNFDTDVGKLFILEFSEESRECIRLLYRWNIAMISYQRNLESIFWQWGNYNEWHIRSFASKLPPDRRKVFLDEITRRAKSDAKEIELLNKPII